MSPTGVVFGIYLHPDPVVLPGPSRHRARRGVVVIIDSGENTF
jgi:hypothetical protein